ncbi:MAG: hypothetical protein GY766_01730 [Herbaspirillum sp.]|uniref:hypothetical protein n=1 Tax=Herbaspirillum sp. TaxID=1890675 RepID=UPI00258BABDB|nr:hypothetical protein [Herbaspirillum sp.]MCP3653605.1 hypothetical protein [Herbaspirillum sp.]
MTPSDHNQAEYVRGIQAGRRIERQHNTARTVSRDVLFMCLGVVAGLIWQALLF